MLRFASEPAYQANYCRSKLLRPFALENSNGFEQILAHRIGCQRAKPPCPAERHSYSPRSISEGTKIVNTRFTISTAILSATASLAKLGSIVDDSVQAGIVDFFRSLTYSRSDEEGAKRSEEHTSELQSRFELVCRCLL